MASPWDFREDCVTFQVRCHTGKPYIFACSWFIQYPAGLGIAAHHFKKKRPLAMGIISSGCALGSPKYPIHHWKSIFLSWHPRRGFWRAGAMIHPVMLNKFFNGSIGFHNGVRISGSMNAVLLLVACSIMRTRLPPQTTRGLPLVKWLREPSYVLVLVGYEYLFSSWTDLPTPSRLWFISLGVYYPVFYLQLAAITHSVDTTVAFYSVC